MTYETYYRFERGLRLPLHWAYGDPWEQVHDEEGSVWVDQRSRGAQVWSDVASVALALLGFDRDGEYDPAHGYRLLLSINARRASDSVGEWWAVTREDVTSVRATSAARMADWIRRQVAADGGDAGRWVQRHERELRAEIRRRSRVVRVRWVETLPRPRR